MNRSELETVWKAPLDVEVLRTGCRSASSDWVWARQRSDRWAPAPHGEARHERAPGQDLRKEPRRKHRVERFGYDADGCLRIAERFARGDVVQTLLLEPAGDGWLARHYDDDELTLLEHRAPCEAPARRVVTYFGPPFGWGLTTEDFHYEDGRLIRVDFDRAGRNYEIQPELSGMQRGFQRLEYAPDGSLAAVVEEYASPQPSAFRFLAVGDSWDILRPQLVAGLAAVYADAIAARDPAEALAAIALRYLDDEPEHFPPALAECGARAWEQLAEEYGEDRLRYNPAEWPEGEIDVALPPALHEASEKARHLMRQGRLPEEAAGELARDIVRALRRTDWAAPRKLLPSFLIFAADYEFEDFEANLEV